jgi:transcriptional regulator with XRE-family HTH domain
MFHVGDVVRKLRLQRGWTGENLAREAGVNKMTISSIERGENHTREKLHAIARALGLPDSSTLDARLHQWADHLASDRDLSPGALEWLQFYEMLEAADPHALIGAQVMLRRVAALIRRKAQPDSAAAAESRTIDDTPAARRRSRRAHSR